MFYLFKGIILGFAIAAPIGPMAMLCIQRALNGRVKNGLLTGVGIATADMVDAGVAAFGLFAILIFLTTLKPILMGVGGIFLIYLAIKSFFKKAEVKEAAKVNGGANDYVSAFLLTLTNPMTILSFIAIFAGLSVGSVRVEAVMITVGVFIGSTPWWCVLLSIVAMIKHSVDVTFLKWINRLSGSILFLFGCVALFEVLKLIK